MLNVWRGHGGVGSRGCVWVDGSVCACACACLCVCTRMALLSLCCHTLRSHRDPHSLSFGLNSVVFAPLALLLWPPPPSFQLAVCGSWGCLWPDTCDCLEGACCDQVYFCGLHFTFTVVSFHFPLSGFYIKMQWFITNKMVWTVDHEMLSFSSPCFLRAVYGSVLSWSIVPCSGWS